MSYQVGAQEVQEDLDEPGEEEQTEFFPLASVFHASEEKDYKELEQQENHAHPQEVMMMRNQESQWILHKVRQRS